MEPIITVGNIFDQDADMLADFAHEHRFAGIDWSIDPAMPTGQLMSRMKKLDDFEVRFHCRFAGTDIAYADERSEKSLTVLKKTVEQVAGAGGRYMTVHIGLGCSRAAELDKNKAVRNLGALVKKGNECGVCVCLENLCTPFTNDPVAFNSLIEQTGAGITFDIGHAYVCSTGDGGGGMYNQYIFPHRHRIMNAHIYHTESTGRGHIAPRSLDDIYERLELLQSAQNCTWWVIELQDPADVLLTRDLVRSYLASCDDRSLCSGG